MYKQKIMTTQNSHKLKIMNIRTPIFLTFFSMIYNIECDETTQNHMTEHKDE